MRKSKELVGLPVMDVSMGNVVGRVRQIILSPSDRRIAGFVVGGRFGRDKVVVRFGDILSLGDDAVTIEGTNCIRKLRQSPELQKLTTAKGQLYNASIMTTTGRHLGMVDEILVSDAGDITHLVVSEGVLRDLVRGMKTIAAGYIKAVGEDAVIVAAETKIITKSQPGEHESRKRKGIRAQQTKDKKTRWNGLSLIRRQPSASEVEKGEPSVGEVEGQSATPKAPEANAAATDAGVDAVESSIPEQKFAGEAETKLKDPVVAGPGSKDAANASVTIAQEDNDSVDDQAQEDDTRQLESLWNGTLDRAKDVTDRVSRKVVYLRVERQDTPEAGTVSDQATKTQFSYIWEHWQRKLENLRAGVDARGAEYLVGKQAATTVVDREGRLIVNAGETITEEIIEQGREANRLYHLALAAAVKDVDDRIQSLKERFLPKSTE